MKKSKEVLLEDNHIHQELWGMEVDENVELRKDLDDLIKTFYGWGLSKKTYDGSDYTLNEEGYVRVFQRMVKLSKKYELYPYNQEVVRMKDEWENK
jgi:hypothetical protein